ncbi:MAG TPA: hypothetical protein VJ801_03115 [Polyangia bacterium]|jgi:hypothetical protein|nr:hypothetical protein [Polyangia bacterium]
MDGPVATPDALVDGRVVALDALGSTRDALGATTDAPDATPDSLADAGALDAPAVTPDAPADAAEAGSDAMVDREAGDSGPQPRVPIIDPATDALSVIERAPIDPVLE